MRRSVILIVCALLVFVGSGAVSADDTDDLIELDKKWGEAGTSGDTETIAKILADDLVSVFEGGVRGKEGELADTGPSPAGAKYEPTDYKVTFVDSDTAIMTHSTKGENSHHSLHVWSKKSGSWLVIATSTTPVADD